MSMPLGLAYARVVHREDGMHAPDYDDVYCAREGGLDESRHVFLDGNDLSARLAGLAASQVFVVGETGFGAGRNMLATWALFETQAPPRARLHLFSVERHPLRAADLRRLVARWPTLTVQIERLASLWPAPVQGMHRLALAPRVTLDLYLGEAEAGLAAFEGQVDAWFLDGFAPARNPAMWSPALCQALAARSRPGTTMATYSAARGLRDALTAAGFVWTRRPGFARKRHMLTGRFEGQATGRAGDARPWYSQPSAVPPHGRIAVIGAGIAGTTVADALARRGREVTIYDAAGPGGGASGNRDAALSPRLAVEPTVRTRFDLAALAYATRWLADHDPERTLWQDCGLLQLARSRDEVDRQARMLAGLGLPRSVVHGVDAATAAKLAGTRLASDVRGGLYFPGGASVRPAALCAWLVQRSGVTWRDHHVTALSRHEAGWAVVDDAGGWAVFDHVVLANAGAAAMLCPDLPPLGRVRGQASHFALAGAGNDASPACVVCDRGYVLPARGGRQSVGATYEPRAADLVVHDAEHEANRGLIGALLPDLAAAIAVADVRGRASWRCTSHDRLPLVGGVPDRARWCSDYAALGHDATQPVTTAGALWPGLSVSLAHGSHGMLRAPLAAEMLASALTGAPQPVAGDLVEALHPGRWLIRQIIRGRVAPDQDMA
ncbi:bifunctional tRNA (5-methylaminomethyl-2-thiouridine)(34)-methyltransferase MnmD/FAD-dependent 5-carboxymethylaminomethyl-2-thiouridine(34) oxidoreductase MnmC [Salinisphaera sp. Q1T1-3]|uniref:bifunctional tRNA (5-methylaminomethyl-2-thiouridine)(34)-methyltransferase MnmD/FAD-dependent 5-carboxymethylaminomethyl-2-thiouridine(34) oxidoreductase MnmC n=1 Tax=Salinisphaera sp. Q1T1-3 TaxID=2321229 RepID=UPI000E725F56|nr:bifunctional tRNA (5-methylaminomethyl-2-thiouridine)(34)-methyltransferase MnmD/FAD-dependent 5-carboxymethylaminomethyl-2-thiouridine(34) oxidoreductase MnmC [Salinisphaera sp. Q1T1-3]RJS94087.1 bifunctional tRNA (5-methylaminomethyl-2-thiouridine)(34)-methyltransferase MnmD/FAD-dependent 5-carboxymethylaminomethyl-2-thiouridine(34) oxidoreductase MnmC [Salinisphaera sp. Q1T1-3]